MPKTKAKAPIFFTAGPSKMNPKVKGYIADALQKNIPSISHRGREFEKIYVKAETALRTLLKIPSTHHILFLASGNEGLERVIQNSVGRKSLHLVNGAFSKRFYDMALQYKKKPVKHEAAWGEGFALNTLHVESDIELIGLTHNESATGVMTPISEIYKLAKANKHALVAIDVVSSVPYGSLDFRYLDYVIFSVQKGFGLPAGLGVVILSDRALAKSQVLKDSGVSIGSYHSFPKMMALADRRQTPETPNVLNIYLLGRVARDMIKKGVSRIKKETDAKAALMYDFLDTSRRLTPFVHVRALRSPTLIVVETNNEAQKIIKKAKTHGFILGGGYGMNKISQIRIANYPQHTLAEFKSLIKFLKSI